MSNLGPHPEHYTMEGYPHREGDWALIEGSARKQGDAFDETCRIELSQCTLERHVSRLWKRTAAKA